MDDAISLALNMHAKHKMTFAVHDTELMFVVGQSASEPPTHNARFIGQTREVDGTLMFVSANNQVTIEHTKEVSQS